MLRRAAQTDLQRIPKHGGPLSLIQARVICWYPMGHC